MSDMVHDISTHGNSFAFAGKNRGYSKISNFDDVQCLIEENV